jgi:adenine-specific DNA-methyltransferase
MLLDHAESLRRDVSPRLEQKTKAQLGQFLTPAPVARFMASMFPTCNSGSCRLLDAGAGLGALTFAFLDRWRKGELGFSQVDSTCFELDDALRAHLADSFSLYAKSPDAPLALSFDIRSGDFVVQAALDLLQETKGQGYTHVIMNPPYKKILSSSLHRRALQQVGIDTVNLYSAFVALAIELMAPGGLLVAIIPRSFCNGTYYRPFREWLLDKTAIVHMHLFDSRSKAFRDDDVLQENIIIMLQRGGTQGAVTVSTSTDDSFSDLRSHQHPFERIVTTGQAERFIHVPTDGQRTELEAMVQVRYSLEELGLRISTGPVVDFRLKPYLCELPQADAAPLLYPAHFAGHHTAGDVTWPLANGKKPNAIQINDQTLRWLVPNGFYCVVKRFSAKEEKRRIVAYVLRPDAFPVQTEFLGLENHLNFFRTQRAALTEILAFGLTAYLNTSAVEEAFRRFSGHTQVNASDLRTLRYPSLKNLECLGDWYMRHLQSEQSQIDTAFRELMQ